MALDLNRTGLANHNNNDMTRLLNTIEIRLQLTGLPLPAEVAKNSWADVIMDQSIPTFSQYFGHVITVIVTPDVVKDGYFFLDGHIPQGTKVLGLIDLDFRAYKSLGNMLNRNGVYIDQWTMMSNPNFVDDIQLAQTGSDIMSLFNLNIFPKLEGHNRIRLESVNGGLVSRFNPFPVKLMVEHPGLHTISPTMRETLLKICMVDIADWILSKIKYFESTENGVTSIDLKLDRLQDWSNKREDVLREYMESNNTTANQANPIMWNV